MMRGREASSSRDPRSIVFSAHHFRQVLDSGPSVGKWIYSAYSSRFLGSLFSTIFLSSSCIALTVRLSPLSIHLLTYLLPTRFSSPMVFRNWQFASASIFFAGVALATPVSFLFPIPEQLRLRIRHIRPHPRRLANMHTRAPRGVQCSPWINSPQTESPGPAQTA